MRMYTGDLKPDLQITVASRDEAVDLTTASSVRIIGVQDDLIIFDRAPDDIDVVGDTTVLTMEWQTGDTDEQGRITFEVEATWPGTKPQSFRPPGGVDVWTDFDAGF